MLTIYSILYEVKSVNLLFYDRIINIVLSIYYNKYLFRFLKILCL